MERYQRKVYSIAYGFLRNQEDALDVVQEAFIKVHRYIHKFQGNSGFYTWLYRIASNAAKNYLVARGRRPLASADVDDAEYFEDAESLRDIDTPETRYFGGELAKAVQQTLDDMPDELRIALTLREFDGLSYEEIADVMACPVGTVRSRIFRAREAVDNRVQAQMMGE